MNNIEPIDTTAEEKELFKQKVKRECTYHAPTTEGQRNNHERVNTAVLILIYELIEICPVCDQLEEAISHVKTARNKANEGLAVHVNAKALE